MNSFCKALAYTILVLFGLQSCANYKLNYINEVEDWADYTPPRDSVVKHTVYLIGDTGNAKKDKTIPIFKFLKAELDQASEDNSIIFLGDNIYPVGMPPKSLEYQRDLAEHKLDVQLDMLENFDGNIMFIPGNHDWAKYGLKGVKRQQKYIEKNLNEQKNGTTDDDDKDWEEYFLPRKGCGDPEVVKINDQLVIVLIDSQWWLKDWNTDQAINQGCEIQTRAGFYREFEDIVRKYRDKNVIVAMHHPLYSAGQHGGHYTIENHIFPLRFLNKGLYIPLPVVGSAIAFVRSAVGVPQDVATAKYKRMRNDIMGALTKNGSYIVAAGHEHTLQYLKNKGQHFIVSGSGSKENAASLRDGAEFSFGRLGYAKIDFYQNGSGWLYYYALNDEKDGMEEVYRKKIKEKLEISKSNIPDAFPEYEEHLTIKKRKPTNFDFKKVGPVHRAILGEHYSDIYLKEYNFKVLELDKYEGGVVPLKRGGGNQTNSLRLGGADDKEYVMRALTKDPSRTLPYPLNQVTQAKNILQDNFMAAYPFAALMVPPMADAANVYHTNPELYYIPKQPALDYQNDLFGGDVYLVEERPDGDWSNLESFGNSEKIISTSDVIEKIIKARKHRIDEKWVVRSRLFDLMIKDWDRHEDQWRWASFEDEKGKYYRPIPRDRDQPFAKYDGLITWIIYAVNPFMRQLQTFTPDVKNIKWQSWNATYFDQTFLGELEWEDWENEAIYIRDNVTDEAIEKGFNQVPEEARDEDWKQMLEDTKSRRDNIVKFARMAYNLKSKVVDVLGTEDRDMFEIERISDDQTLVKVFDMSNKGEIKDLVYERVFDHDITKEVHLYGMEDDDLFVIKGSVNRSLKIRIIGGGGKDEVKEASSVKLGGKKTYVYDSDIKKNKFDFGKEGKDKTSRRVALNTYDRRSFHYDPNYWLPLPNLGFNPDDGLIIGGIVSYIKNKFKKLPYGAKHTIKLDYSLGTSTLNFNYDAEILEAVGTWDVVSDFALRRNRFAFNYFGYGNDSENPDPDDLDFNRVRQSRIYYNLGLRKRFLGNSGSFSIGPLIERTRIEDTQGRFITSSDAVLPSNVFEERIYAGAKTKLSIQSLDQTVNPHKGIKFELSYDWETTIGENDLTYGKFGVGVIFYQPIDRKKYVILASQIGYESIMGDFDFFKAPTIGGLTNMRGFRRERFRGDQVFYQSIDLRIKLVRSINNVLPFTFGIHGGFDYGKVWQNEVDSDKLHTSYGGGIWLDPIDFLVISVGQYFSEEDRRFIFKLTHMF